MYRKTLFRFMNSANSYTKTLCIRRNIGSLGVPYLPDFVIPPGYSADRTDGRQN